MQFLVSVLSMFWIVSLPSHTFFRLKFEFRFYLGYNFHSNAWIPLFLLSFTASHSVLISLKNRAKHFYATWTLPWFCIFSTISLSVMRRSVSSILHLFLLIWLRVFVLIFAVICNSAIPWQFSLCPFTFSPSSYIYQDMYFQSFFQLPVASLLASNIPSQVIFYPLLSDIFSHCLDNEWQANSYIWPRNSKPHILAWALQHSWCHSLITLIFYSLVFELKIESVYLFHLNWISLSLLCARFRLWLGLL